jgi:hypothetical protein
MIKLTNFEFLIYLLRWSIVGILVLLLGLLYHYFCKRP